MATLSILKKISYKTSKKLEKLRETTEKMCTVTMIRKGKQVTYKRSKRKYFRKPETEPKSEEFLQTRD